MKDQIDEEWAAFEMNLQPWEAKEPYLSAMHRAFYTGVESVFALQKEASDECRRYAQAVIAGTRPC